MSHQGLGGPDGYDESHRLHDMPASGVQLPYSPHLGQYTNLTLQYHLPPRNGDGSDDEAERSLLHQNQGGPFNGPFDEPHSRMATPPIRPASSYTLSESYVGDNGPTPTAYHDPYSGHPGAYSGTTLEDPTAAHGAPNRAPSPYSRSETSSTEAWRQRQAPAAGGLRRYATRKVKLGHGSVLSLEYPVPSPIQNDIQAKYRNDLESGNEEFTHLRCEATSPKSG